MSQKINLLTVPALAHHRTPDSDKVLHHQVMTRATKEVSCAVIADIVREGDCGWRVRTAVQYQKTDVWYMKDTCFVLDFESALKKAYGLSRKLYHVTASRALAGLLSDSIVPATEDIDC